MIENGPSEITPEHVYLQRRRFMVGMAAVAASAVLAACGQQNPPRTSSPTRGTAAGAGTPASEATGSPSATATSASTGGAGTDELGDKFTPEGVINGYNNYYEFSLGKEGIGDLAKGFKTAPWQVTVGGLVRQPKSFDMSELLRFGQEERVYRLRCVEAWSMVVPWVGFPLKALLDAVEPMPEAKFVRFETVLAPDQMPGQRSRQFTWPYVEGLRLDEAMHDLTILATGLYGKPLPPQDGAPIRLVVPWKYGFKCVKAIVKIDLVDKMPATFWPSFSPSEYGFFANVNPAVSHPRWSQATERRIGESGRRKTLPFNGYAAEVARLYDGMDPSKLY